MDTFYLIAHLQLAAEAADAFAPVFNRHADASRKKAGNIFFYLLRNRENPAHFSTMEAWESLAYLEQHLNDPEHQAFQTQLQAQLEAPVDERRYFLSAD